ncbi:MAG: M48 family metallopeptidase, partial [Puniceicoccales bacterium]
MRLNLVRVGILTPILVILLSSCYTVPETGRSSFTLLPESQVKSMGISSFEEIKETAPLITSGRNYEMIQRVGTRIANAVGNDIPNAEWEFIYIDEDQVNAFALPGGKIAVYDGMFDVIDSEDELAFILGHEVAHVSARHANQRLSQAMVLAGIGVGVGYA